MSTDSHSSRRGMTANENDGNRRENLSRLEARLPKLREQRRLDLYVRPNRS
jgi:hypothetical protein